MYCKSYSTTRSMRASKNTQDKTHTNIEKHVTLDNLVDDVIDAFGETDSEIDEDEQELRPPFKFTELIKIALIQSVGVVEMTEEEIISEIDVLFPYYQKMKEFDNVRKMYIDTIHKVLEETFENIATVREK